MQYIHNPMTGTVRYVTPKLARFLLSYGWRKASFEQFMAYQVSQYWLYPVRKQERETDLRQYHREQP